MRCAMKDKKNLIVIIMLLNTIINIVIVFLIPTKNPSIPEPKQVDINFTLNDPATNTSEINQIYQDPKAHVSINQTDYSSHSKTNLTHFKNNHLNTYFISYTVPVGTYRKEEIFRKVTVVDTKGPVLSLKGATTMKLNPGTEYKEPGYEAIDAFDGDVSKLVKVTGTVNYNKEGTYTRTYKATDKRGNETTKTRTVIIQAGVPPEDSEEKPSTFDPTGYKNTVTHMEYTEKGIFIKGYVKESSKTYTLIVKGPTQRKVEMKSTKSHFYKGDIDVTTLPTGIYTFQIEGGKKENLLVKLEEEDKLIRAHIGDKLVTFTYKKDQIQMKIEKFKYQYDIVIDPGHGGSDVGATVNGITEKKMNLEVSLYEKKRYEEHGFTVKLLRTDDTYGDMLGNKEWAPITKRAYTAGYYGSVSRYTYSNHHNAIEDPTFMGWEVLLPSILTEAELIEEHQVVEAWNQIYPPLENHIRMYARNYETGGIYNKINGQFYGFKDYYAVNRMPYKNFSVKAPIYENIYMSNHIDFEWYYTKGNYKKMSEAKIKVYVEALGGTYKQPKEKE